MKTEDELLGRLLELSLSPREVLSIADWKKSFDQEKAHYRHSIDQALMGGVLADRTAYAFASGYLSALRLMFPDYAHDGYSSLCVTEEGGNRPSDINTSLQYVEEENGGKWLLNGTKTFVTGGCEAEQLFIAAASGSDTNGRKKIRVVRVFAGQQGMNISPLPELPFVPEISHAAVTFDNAVVNVSDILPGDGYSGYVKLFRTIEDVHVSTAILGYIAQVAIAHRWTESHIEKILALLLCHRQLGLLDPAASMTHIGLAGVRSQMNLLLEQIDNDWKQTDEQGYKLWVRDRSLLNIAGKAGRQRRKNAWLDIFKN